MSDDAWQNVIFLDKSTFELFDSNKRQYCYHKNGTRFEKAYLSPIVKLGGGNDSLRRYLL